MKYVEQRPCITQHEFIFEPEDELYEQCKWLKIRLDHGNWTMIVEGDCGSFTKKWHPTVIMSFAQYLCKIKEEALLDAIADGKVVELEKTKLELIRQLETVKETLSPEIYEWMTFVIGKYDYLDPVKFREKVYMVAGSVLPPDGITIITDYPAELRMFSAFFVKEFQPILRRKIEGTSYGEPLLKGMYPKKSGMMSEALLEHNKAKLRGKQGESPNCTELVIPVKNKEEKIND